VPPSTFTVPLHGGSQRLDRFLAAQMPELSRSRLTALIKQGAIQVNARLVKPSYEMQPGDKVAVTILADTPADAVAQDLPLNLLYEDEELAVINKASGMVVHPGAGNEDGTLVNALLHRYGPLSSIGGVQRPGIVHRLDKETSGCLVIARTDQTHEALSRQFASRQTEKTYLAVVQGIPAVPAARIENYMARNPTNRLQMTVVPPVKGKLAITDYTVVHSLGTTSLVKCDLHTGRTHQIRVHLKHLGHPLLGDEIYARPARQNFPVPRMMLHAWRLGFTHPKTAQPLRFQAPLPPEFSPFLPQSRSLDDLFP